MAQCEKVLDDGQRCSNPAVPGARYCQTHGRIVFKPVHKPADTAPPPSPEKPAPPSDGPDWRAKASAFNQAAHFPGLEEGQRGILVAPEGYIWVEPPEQVRGDSAYNRLVRLLGAFSQAVDLAGQVEIFEAEQGDYYLHLTPAQGANRVSFFDTASAAARMVDARVYIGQERCFVQYRDASAPRGYDVLDFSAPGGSNLLLVAHWGSRTFNPEPMRRVPLSEFCLRVTLRPCPPDELPEVLYALTPVALYQILARYLGAHHLRYSLARFQSEQGELLLFKIGPRPGAPAGPHVPAFVLAHLARLPRVSLLTLVYQHGSQYILQQWGRCYPLDVPHVAATFPEDGYVALTGDPYRQNLLISPCPTFFDGDSLAQVHVPGPRPLHLSPRAEPGTQPLNLPVLLRPDLGPIPPTHALLLTVQEVGWLRQLLYRLPGEVFGDYRLCLGDDGAILLGGAQPIQGIPFGLALRRVAETELFIPLRARFVPDLPWPLLSQALQISADQYTFLTETARIDLPVSSFFPLSRALVADGIRPRVKFSLRQDIGLPLPTWTPPAPPASSRAHAGRTSPAQPTPGGGSTAPVAPANPQEAWRAQAQVMEEGNDFLGAAMCYALLNDTTASARCLQRILTHPAENAGQE